MRFRYVALGVLLSMLVAAVALAQAQATLVTLSVTQIVTLKKTSLPKVINGFELYLSPVNYSGSEIGVAGGIVVANDGVGPKKPPFHKLTVEVLQRNDDGSTQSLGEQDVQWGQIYIAGNPVLGLPDLPLALVVVELPPPPAGSFYAIEMTAKGGDNQVPPDFTVAPIGAGLDLEALGLAGPAAAQAIVDELLQAVDRLDDGRGRRGTIPR